MDPDKAKNADKAAGADVKIETLYLCPEYRLVQVERAMVTESRLLEIFRLDPCDSTLPILVGRWDQGRNELDVDLVLEQIAGISRFRRFLISGRFKRANSGYSGHHTREAKLHQYEVDITISGRDFPTLCADPRVFSGIVTLSRMLFEKHLIATVRSVALGAQARVCDSQGRDITAECARPKE